MFNITVESGIKHHQIKETKNQHYNILVTSGQSVLLVDDNQEYPDKTFNLLQVNEKLVHIKFYQVHLYMVMDENKTNNFSGYK